MSLSTWDMIADEFRRLAYYNLEIRDNYFSRLKAKIEQFKKHNGKKVVLCTHSYVLPCMVTRWLTAAAWAGPSWW